MRILLIEDNPGDVRLLQEHLLKDRSGPEAATMRPAASVVAIQE